MNMSNLVDEGVVSKQPNQGVTMNGHQQHQLRQQSKTSPSPGSQQSQPTASQTSVNTGMQQTAGNTSNLDTNDNIQADQNSSTYNKHYHGSGHTRSGGSRQYNNDSSQQYNPAHQQHHKQNNNNNNQITSSSRGDNESNINHVLLITVINPHYPINCGVINKICSDYGKVNRIVIFKKNGVQAMVEFDDVESAKRARSMLHGCDIYSGCCTLRVEYAKPSRLNVHRNDSESFDYTNPDLGLGEGIHEHDPTVAHAASGHQQHHGKGGGRRSMGGGDTNSLGAPQHHHVHQQHHPNHFHQAKHHHQQQSSSAIPPDTSGHHHHMYGIASNQSSLADPSGYQQHQPGPSQESFGVSRSNVHIHPVGASDVSGSQSEQGGYVSMDPMTMAPGSHTGNAFSRHEDQNPHHQHHHHHHHQQHHSRDPRMGGGGSGSGGSSGGGPSGGMNHHHHHHQQQHQHHGHRGHHHSHHSQHSHFGHPNSASMAGPAGMSSQGTVMMVYNLNLERVNCDRLFNLFCLYGNVVRVKFLRTKDGCAMVQMGDVLAVDRCVSSLNKITLFGSELQISYSKQAFLHDVIQPFTLPDGSPSFKDFMGNKNNRFKNPELARITEEELISVFKQSAGCEPVTLRTFPPKTENSKSNSGLVTFRDPVEASEVLVLCNHLIMPRAGAPHPYVLRLCFSPPTYARHAQHHHQQHQSQQVCQEASAAAPSSMIGGQQATNLSGSTTTPATAAAATTTTTTAANAAPLRAQSPAAAPTNS